MSLEALLDHRCDIYHIAEEPASPGYGLPDSPSFSYPDAPDEAGVACHFCIKSASAQTEQTAPANLLEVKTKLVLPFNTDIRINDKIIDCDTGDAFTAENPRPVRQHHRFVYIKRIDRQKEL